MQVAVALTFSYLPSVAGLAQTGALTQVMLVTISVPQRTTGGVIAVPTVPNLGTLAQVRVPAAVVELELLDVVPELLDVIPELLDVVPGVTLELLCIELSGQLLTTVPHSRSQSFSCSIAKQPPPHCEMGPKSQ